MERGAELSTDEKYKVVGKLDRPSVPKRVVRVWDHLEEALVRRSLVHISSSALTAY